MPDRDEEFLKKLAATFAVEADEHLNVFSSDLLSLEKNPPQAESKAITERIFREIHSLKGAARVVSRKDIERICQPLETVLGALKDGTQRASPELLDLLHEAAGALREKMEAAGNDGDPQSRASDDQLVAHLDAAAKGQDWGAGKVTRKTARKPAAARPPTPSPQSPATKSHPAGRSKSPATSHQPPATKSGPAETSKTSTTSHQPPATRLTQASPEPAKPAKTTAPVAAETVRVATAKLDELFRQIEELISSKLAAAQRVSEIRNLIAQLQASAGGEGDAVAALDDGLRALSGGLEADRRSLGKMVDGLLEDAKKLLMLPCSAMFEALPRMVRELARDQRKDIDIFIEGGDIEVDRRIQEQLKDALVHLVRNCVDHGIEPPEARVTAGKPARAAIRLTVSQVDVSKAEIVVSDDGAGIDLDNVREIGRRLGLNERDGRAKMDERELAALVFRSGVSTSAVVTDLSGRGLGLAIVQEKVEKLGGTISVETHRGAGTTFRMVLPLTLAAMRGVVVEAVQSPYVFPGASVERVVRAREEDIRTVENRESVRVDDEVVSVVTLTAALGLPAPADAGEDQAFRNLVIVTSGGERIAFAVDRIVGEQEVLLKGLGPQISRVRNISGATVLGTGTLAPILNVTDLIKSGKRAAIAAAPAKPGEQEVVSAKRILVAEDSITARSLLKNILQASGYAVEAAVDGVDALTTLRTGEFGLVVSDVEMPRMDGFELTARIRADQKLAGIPVILVTALDSREHRERGIEAGADAYIVKSSFDQSALLETIRRLI